MSNTNATASALAFGSMQPTLNILCDIYGFLAAASLVTLIYLVKFIAFDETLSLGTKLTWRAVSNKFNVTLLIGEVSLIGYYAFEAVHLYDDESRTSLYAVAAYICLANLQACLMWYTWLRGEAIFDIVLPGLPPFMKVMVPAATVFLYIPSVISVIAAFMGSNNILKSIYRIMTAVSGLLLLLFDVIVCVSFSIYLRKAAETVALLKSDQTRFRITCFYGLITSFFEGVAICGYVFALTRASVMQYQIVMAVVRVFMICGLMSLVLLKVALHRQKEAAKAVRVHSALHSSHSSSVPRSNSHIHYVARRLLWHLSAAMASCFPQHRVLSLEACAKHTHADAYLNSLPFAVLSHTGVPAAIVDPAMLYANDAALRLFKYSESEFIGMPSRLTARPEDRDARECAMGGVGSSGFSVGYSGKRVAKDGTVLMIEQAVLWNVVGDSGVVGQAAGLVGVKE
ncbi:MEKHLA domain-containing protein [Chytriomyces cf. hyalinus JEL632]|nr:MEKHLA domain-containing protein [Chytriomyces cf. hyalinus JEL632]